MVLQVDTAPVVVARNVWPRDDRPTRPNRPRAAPQFVGCAINVIGCLVAIAAATKGILVLALVPVMLLYNAVQRLFRRSSTEISRVIALSKSPIFAGFSEVSIDRRSSFHHRGTQHTKTIENGRVFVCGWLVACACAPP